MPTTSMKDLCWGKLDDNSSDYKTLEQHMFEVGVAMEVLLTESAFSSQLDYLTRCCGKNMSNREVVNFLCFIASMHDIGKCVPDFQCRKEAQERGLQIVDEWNKAAPSTWVEPIQGFRHELASREILRMQLRAYTSRTNADIYASIAGLHHQGKAKSATGFVDPFWTDIQNELLESMYKAWKPKFPKRLRRSDGFAYTTLGLVILADRIASSLFDAHTNLRKNQIKNAVYDWLENTMLSKRTICAPESFEACWEHKPFAKNPTPLQRDVSQYFMNASAETCPSLVMIEGEMGSGKTELMLYLALAMADFYGKSGFYFALPTMATANGMWDRVEDLMDILHYSEAKLVHSQAWLHDSLSRASKQHAWITSGRMSLMQNIGVGTIDQALSSVLRIRYGVLKLLGLSGKVLIIDEVHSYDDYQLAIIRRLIEFCRALNIPVVMASGTMPIMKKRELLSGYTSNAEHFAFSEAYPICTMVLSNEDREIIEIATAPSYFRKYNVESAEMSTKAIAAELVEKMQQGGNVCYIANTVNRAQVTYQYVKDMLKASRDPEDFSEPDTTLLHSRFTVLSRQDIERKLLKKYGKDKSNRPAASITVATQVIESSLDLDYDWMITDIAPVDAILQRIGRLFRHDHTIRSANFQEPHVKIVTGEAATGGNIYDSVYVSRSEELIKKTSEIKFPDDIRSIMEYVYQSYNPTVANLQNPQELYQKLTAEQERRVEVPTVLMSPGTYSKGRFTDLELGQQEDDEDVPMTRLGIPTVRFAVIPQWLKDQYDSEVASFGYPKFNTSRSISEYMVTCTQNQFNKIDADLLAKFSEGEGHLHGSLLAAVDKDFKANEYATIQSAHWRIEVDPEVGFILSKIH